jgi:DNA polymerase-4
VSRRVVLHVDMDAFYVSVELRRRPELVGQPVVVGGTGPRGVVAAASYEARRFGVTSALPSTVARRRCPHAVFLPGDHQLYAAVSRDVHEIFRRFTPVVEPLALDEAFLDVAGVRRLHGTGPEVAATIRTRVHDETGLVASVGVATTKHVAKLASQEAKPDGLFVVEPGEELAFLHPLDVGRLWGVGPATRKRLEQVGVHTVGELAALSEDTLVHALGPAQGGHLHALAWNRDERPVVPHQEAKSVGHEETFARDIADRSQLEREALRMAERVASRLRAGGRAGRTVQLKLRYRDFRTITRSRTVVDATAVGAEIGTIARELLDAVDIGDGIRLLGVSVQQLEEAKAVQEQLPLDETASPADRHAAVERSVDALRERFGDDAVGLASLSDRGRGPRYPTKEQVQEPE